MKRMPTVLFDIDGTLIDAAGAGRRAMQRTVWQLYGIADTPEVALQGRTDFAIFGEVLSLLACSTETHYPVFRRHYLVNLDRELNDVAAVRPTLLPGVAELVGSLLAGGDWGLGLVTGNGRAAAMSKLRTVAMDRYFRDGGFGDWTACRNEVAAEALRRCCLMNSGVRDRVTVMIGDTVHDVTCAKSIGVPVIAVLTGGSSAEDMARCGADLIVESLREVTPQRMLEFG